MERTMISWNIANWVTVMLMAAAGYGLAAVVSQIFMRRGTTPGPGAGGAY